MQAATLTLKECQEKLSQQRLEAEQLADLLVQHENELRQIENSIRELSVEEIEGKEETLRQLQESLTTVQTELDNNKREKETLDASIIETEKTLSSLQKTEDSPEETPLVSRKKMLFDIKNEINQLIGTTNKSGERAKEIEDLFFNVTKHPIYEYATDVNCDEYKFTHGRDNLFIIRNMLQRGVAINIDEARKAIAEFTEFTNAFEDRITKGEIAKPKPENPPAPSDQDLMKKLAALEDILISVDNADSLIAANTALEDLRKFKSALLSNTQFDQQQETIEDLHTQLLLLDLDKDQPALDALRDKFGQHQQANLLRLIINADGAQLDNEFDLADNVVRLTTPASLDTTYEFKIDSEQGMEKGFLSTPSGELPNLNGDNHWHHNTTRKSRDIEITPWKKLPCDFVHLVGDFDTSKLQDVHSPSDFAYVLAENGFYFIDKKTGIFTSFANDVADVKAVLDLEGVKEDLTLDQNKLDVITKLTNCSNEQLELINFSVRIANKNLWSEIDNGTTPYLDRDPGAILVLKHGDNSYSYPKGDQAKKIFAAIRDGSYNEGDSGKPIFFYAPKVAKIKVLGETSLSEIMTQLEKIAPDVKKDVVVATCNVGPENKIQETIQLAGAEDKENLLPRGAAKKEESKEMTTLNEVIEALQSGLAGNTAADRFGDAVTKFTTARDTLTREGINPAFLALVTSVETALGNQVGANTALNQKTLTDALNELIKNLTVDKGPSSERLKIQIESIQTSLNGVVLASLKTDLTAHPADFVAAKTAFENAKNALPDSHALKAKITAVHGVLDTYDAADPAKRAALQTSLTSLIGAGAAISDELKTQVEAMQTALNGVVLATLKTDLTGHTSVAEFSTAAKTAFAIAKDALPDSHALKAKITAVHSALDTYDATDPLKRTALQTSLTALIGAGVAIPNELKTQVEAMQSELNNVVLATLKTDLTGHATEFTTAAKTAFANAKDALPASHALKAKINAVHGALDTYDATDAVKRTALQTKLSDLVGERAIPDELKTQVVAMQTALNDVVLASLKTDLTGHTSAAEFSTAAKTAFENAKNALPDSHALKAKITAVHSVLDTYDATDPLKRTALQTSLTSLIGAGAAISDELKTQVEAMQTELNNVVLATLKTDLTGHNAEFTTAAKTAFANARNALPDSHPLKAKFTAVHGELDTYDAADPLKRTALQTKLSDLIGAGVAIPNELKTQVVAMQTALNDVVLASLKTDLTGHTSAAEFSTAAKTAFANARNAISDGDLKNYITNVHNSLFDAAIPAENTPDKRSALQTQLSHLSHELERTRIAPDLKTQVDLMHAAVLNLDPANALTPKLNELKTAITSLNSMGANDALANAINKLDTVLAGFPATAPEHTAAKTAIEALKTALNDFQSNANPALDSQYKVNVADKINLLKANPNVATIGGLNDALDTFKTKATSRPAPTPNQFRDEYKTLIQQLKTFQNSLLNTAPFNDLGRFGLGTKNLKQLTDRIIKALSDAVISPEMKAKADEVLVNINKLIEEFKTSYGINVAAAGPLDQFKNNCGILINHLKSQQTIVASFASHSEPVDVTDRTYATFEAAYRAKTGVAVAAPINEIAAAGTRGYTERVTDTKFLLNTITYPGMDNPARYVVRINEAGEIRSQLMELPDELQPKKLWKQHFNLVTAKGPAATMITEEKFSKIFDWLKAHKHPSTPENITARLENLGMTDKDAAKALGKELSRAYLTDYNTYLSQERKGVHLPSDYIFNLVISRIESYRQSNPGSKLQLNNPSSPREAEAFHLYCDVMKYDFVKSDAYPVSEAQKKEFKSLLADPAHSELAKIQKEMAAIQPSEKAVLTPKMR